MEGIEIANSTADNLLNSKAEYHQPALHRVTLTRENEEPQWVTGGLRSAQSPGPVASRAELYTTFLQSNGLPKVHKFSAKLKNIRSEQGA